MADSVRVTFDMSRFTFRELAQFEEISGVPAASIGRVTVPTTAMLVAMTYLSLKRDDPNLTVDDVWDMNIETVDFVDPTPAEPTPLMPLEQPAKSRRVKAS